MRSVLLVIITLLSFQAQAWAQGWTASLAGDVTLSGSASLHPRGQDSRPTIADQSDTDTGLRFPAAGQLSFIVDGTRQILWSSTGMLLNADYVNFGATSGTSGYGIRDNAGVMQFKDSGGSWINIAAASNGAPTTATYLVQTADGALSAEQALASLSTGIMRVATTTGVVTSLTDSSGIAANISDESGSGALLFGTSPTITTPTFSGAISGTPSVTSAWTFSNSSVGIRDSDNTHNLVVTPGSNLTANRIFRLTTGDAERTLTMNGDATLDQNVSTTGTPSFTALAFAADAAIRRTTNDTADSGSVAVTGGGLASSERGAVITLFGNENAATGRIVLQPGNVASSDLTLNDSGATYQIFNFIGSTGVGTFTSSSPVSSPGWIFNSTAAGGGFLQLSRSGVSRLRMGTVNGITGAGSVDDVRIFAASNLSLEATSQITSASIAADTTANAANMVVDAVTGRIQRSTSSARYKTNIETMEVDSWRWLLNLQPVTFKGIYDGERLFGGFTAESVAAVAPRGPDGKAMYVEYNKDGQPEGLMYAYLTAPLVKAVQDLTAENAELRARIEALEAK